MDKPSNKKGIMKLIGMMAALGRFISKLGEKRPTLFQAIEEGRQVRMG
jgi:hypothetical protein